MLVFLCVFPPKLYRLWGKGKQTETLVFNDQLINTGSLNMSTFLFASRTYIFPQLNWQLSEHVHSQSHPCYSRVWVNKVVHPAHPQYDTRKDKEMEMFCLIIIFAPWRANLSRVYVLSILPPTNIHTPQKSVIKLKIHCMCCDARTVHLTVQKHAA